MPTKIEINPETLKLVEALLERTDVLTTARSAFQQAYPDAPPEMIQIAVFHVFEDGIEAAFDWIAAAEKFLRNPQGGFDYGATWHIIYHLYNWQQFQAVLPIGKQGILERLGDIKQFLSENASEAAVKVVNQLEEVIKGDVEPPF